MKSDIEISKEAKLKPIDKIAEKIGIKKDDLIPYGKYIAKINVTEECRKEGKLILVTAVNPTAAGEGKTTVSIGLGDALSQLNEKAMLALREPSLGPVFGVKGGATGGGYAQVAPMEDINLHFTGDFHAITSANNLLCAAVDNSINFGNPLNIDEKKIVFRRCMDVNDRALRSIIVGLGNGNGNVREDGFDITAASEVMSVLCLSKNQADLKERLGKIIVAYNSDGNVVTCADLKCENAMTVLLKDAIKPNLVQTLEGTPVFVHGGPFANIAHGCNSIIATREALKRADYVVTEAGFGADLGAEKFLDIKARAADLKVSCVVIVATVKALKLNGGANKDNLAEEDLKCLEKGLPNLLRHIDNIKNVYNLGVVVAINKFSSDTEKELKLISEACSKIGVKSEIVDYFSKGGKGGLKLAESVKEICKSKSEIKYCYDLSESYMEKIEKIAKKIYRAAVVIFSDKAKKDLEKIEKNGYLNLPVCIAKTQYSFSDNPLLLGAPENFNITIREVVLRAGAGFVVAIAGDIMLMPGLSKNPNFANMFICGEDIKGLY